MRCRKKNRPSIRIPFPEEVTIWLDVWFDFFWPLLANEVGVGQPAWNQPGVCIAAGRLCGAGS